MSLIKLEDKLERDLAIANSTLNFLKKEHDITLTGLHQEIERLTHRCSELQFSLALQTKAAYAESVLQEKINTLKFENQEKEKSLQILSDELRMCQGREKESFEQRAWERLQLENQIEVLTRQSQEKDYKIDQLKKQVLVEVDVVKLKAKIEQLYKSGTVENYEKMQDISRRARSPGLPSLEEDWKSISSAGQSSQGDFTDDSLQSKPETLRMVRRSESKRKLVRHFSEGGKTDSHNADLKSEAARSSRRSAVFRHHIKIDDKSSKSTNPPASRLTLDARPKSKFNGQDISELYARLVPPSGGSSLFSHSNPPSSISDWSRQAMGHSDWSRQSIGHSDWSTPHASLPIDFKAGVAKLPPISDKVSDALKLGTVSTIPATLPTSCSKLAVASGFKDMMGCGQVAVSTGRTEYEDSLQE